MEAIVFKLFETLFRLMGILIVTGAIANTLLDLQQRAFDSKRVGLVNMLSINQQLVGKTK